MTEDSKQVESDQSALSTSVLSPLEEWIFEQPDPVKLELVDIAQRQQFSIFMAALIRYGMKLESINTHDVYAHLSRYKSPETMALEDGHIYRGLNLVQLTENRLGRISALHDELIAKTQELLNDPDGFDKNTTGAYIDSLQKLGKTLGVSNIPAYIQQLHKQRIESDRLAIGFSVAGMLADIMREMAKDEDFEPVIDSLLAAALSELQYKLQAYHL